jgi:hypothetical protein
MVSRRDVGSGGVPGRGGDTGDRQKDRSEQKSDRGTPLRPDINRGSKNLTEDSLAGREDSLGRDEED